MQRTKLLVCTVKGCPEPESEEWHRCWVRAYATGPQAVLSGGGRLQCFGGISHQHIPKRSRGGKQIQACYCIGHHDRIDNGDWQDYIAEDKFGQKWWYVQDRHGVTLARRSLNETDIRISTHEDASAAGEGDSAVQQKDEASGVSVVEPPSHVAEAMDTEELDEHAEPLERSRSNVSVVPVRDSMGVLRPLDAHFELTHLELPEEFRFEDADNWVRMVRTSRRGNQWWAGDLANALEARFPDRYSQYDHTDFGYTPESLANAQRVCAHYVIGQRYAALTFGHHALVYGRPDRDQWLSRAVDEQWSVAALRRAVGAVKPRVKRWSLEELEQAQQDWHNWCLAENAKIPEGQTNYGHHVVWCQECSNGIDGFIGWLASRVEEGR